MRRILGVIALVLAIALPVVGALSLAGGLYVRDNVRDELTAQKITFAPAGSPGLPAEIQGYGGTQVVTGSQAKVFANDYIAAHIQSSIRSAEEQNPALAGATTYSDVSRASRENPGNEELSALVESVFRGEMLRASLLSSWGWWTFATILIWVAIGSFALTLLSAAASVGLLTKVPARLAQRIRHTPGRPHPA